AGQRREVPKGPHEKLPGENAHHDGREAIEHVGQESDAVGEPRAAVFGQVQAGADANRKPEQHRESDDDERADDRVRHAAAGFADGLGHVREEREVERSSALRDEVRQNEEQRQHGDHGGRRKCGEHDDVHRAAAYEATPRALADGALPRARPLRSNDARGHSGFEAAPPPTRHTSQRAIALTMIVIMSSVNPTAMSADRCASLLASLNSLAISDAMVYPGASSEAEISWRLPMSIVTAMVSPNARPKPRMMPPMMPDLA